MKPLLYILLFLFPFLSIAQTSPKQTRGETFRTYNSNPSEDVRETTVEVSKSLYGLTFQDRDIDRQYKKAIEQFFKESFRGYDRPGNYNLKLEKKQGYLWVEDRRITKDR